MSDTWVKTLLARAACAAAIAAGSVASAQPAQPQPAQPGQPQPGQPQPAQPVQPQPAQPQPAGATPAAEPDSRVAAAEAESGGPGRSTVIHVAPIEAIDDEELRIVAVVDAAWTEAALMVRYRPRGSTDAYAEAPFERSSAGGYFAVIPASAVGVPGVEYYIAGQLPSGAETVHFASADAPHAVIVAPTQAERWATVELRRLGDRPSSMAMTVWGQDFGNRFGNADEFLRGELEFTHRLLLQYLYSISLGYGFIEGKTPDADDPTVKATAEGARYGYAGVRLRLHPSVWVDGQTAIGVSRDGFIVGGRAQLTLGKPWRSSVDLGAELYQSLGPSLWIRLQWDTVPPFLMGATIMKTDLPAASLEGGAYLAYDISFPIARRITVRGSVSFGSRDGPGRFGGGLGTAFAF